MGIFGRCMWEIHMGDLMHSIHSHMPNAKIPGPASACHPQPWRMILVPRPPVSHVRQYFPGNSVRGRPAGVLRGKALREKALRGMAPFPRQGEQDTVPPSGRRKPDCRGEGVWQNRRISPPKWHRGTITPCESTPWESRERLNFRKVMARSPRARDSSYPS